MSGGFIKPQSSGEHQIVVFTFVGELKGKDVGKWNQAILELKQRFGSSVTGITITGDPTPAEFMSGSHGGGPPAKSKRKHK
jgi:hypothetical protein